jgi:hypothetical protein
MDNRHGIGKGLTGKEFVEVKENKKAEAEG